MARLRSRLLAWYRRTARDLPWRRTRDPYAIWISEVMLQQTTVRTVIPYYERFLARFPDADALARAPEEELLALWSGLGYYTRARNLRAAAEIIVAKYAGRLPRRIEEVLALPGIGRYTAGAIVSIAFGVRAPVVDGNVARVLSRLYAIAPDREKDPTVQPPPRTRTAARGVTPTTPGLSTGTTNAVRAAARGPVLPRRQHVEGNADPGRGVGAASSGSRRSLAGASAHATLWRLAEELVPARTPGEWNQALMELGAAICRPIAPACGACPLASNCRALAAGDPERYPAARTGPRSIRLRAALAAIVRDGRVLLVRRPKSELLGGLWELPGTLAAALESGTPQVKRPPASPEGPEPVRTKSRSPGLARRALLRGRATIAAEPSPATFASGSSRAVPTTRHDDPRIIDIGSSRHDTASSRASTRDRPGAVPLDAALRAAIGFRTPRLSSIGTVRHTVTHRRLEIEAWLARAPRSIPGAFRDHHGVEHRWADLANLDSLPIGAASRKVLALLQPARSPMNEGAHSGSSPKHRGSRAVE